MDHLVYATSNPGKIMEVSRRFADHGFLVRSMRDLGFPDMDVPEPGDTLGENACIKVQAYIEALQTQPALRGQKIAVLSDDTGLEIDGLDGEPGIHVRRWKDKETRMEDEEIIEYALARMQGLTGTDRGAQFRTVLAVGVLYPDGTTAEPVLFDGTLRGRILEEPEQERMAGFPFASLFFVEDWNMLLGVAERLPQGEKEKYLSHRERALDSAVPFLQTLL